MWPEVPSYRGKESPAGKEAVILENSAVAPELQVSRDAG
jgi:hypothetical protein